MTFPASDPASGPGPDRASDPGPDRGSDPGSDRGSDRASLGPARPERPRRREPTAQEAKALAHPLRLQILRLCTLDELTNKQLADRLGSDPGTVLYHVRLLVEAGLLAPAEVRAGKRGALEKPYRSTGLSWWLDDPLGKARGSGESGVPGDLGGSGDSGGDRTSQAVTPSDLRALMLDSFVEEFHQAGPESLAGGARFVLHLTPDEASELERRLLDVLDEYVAGDQDRRAGDDGSTARAAYNGLLMLHRLL